MPKVAKTAAIEEAPHYLRMLSTYSATTITLSLAMIALAAGFNDRLIARGITRLEIAGVTLLWLSLFVVLFSGLLIAAHIMGVSSNYMRALRCAFPDALVLLSQGKTVLTEHPANLATRIESSESRAMMKTALDRATNRVEKAHRWACVSFVAIGIAALTFIGLGLIGYFGGVVASDAESATKIATSFIAEQAFKPEMQIESVRYDAETCRYSVVVRCKQRSEIHTVVVAKVSGRVVEHRLSDNPQIAKP